MTCSSVPYSSFIVQKKAGQKAGFFRAAEKLLLHFIFFHFIFLHVASRSRRRSRRYRRCRGRSGCRSCGRRLGGRRSGFRGGRRSGFFATGAQTQTKCEQRSEEERAFHVFSLDKKELSPNNIRSARRRPNLNDQVDPAVYQGVNYGPGRYPLKRDYKRYSSHLTARLHWPRPRGRRLPRFHRSGR